jgi:hypothetical protein
MMARWSMWACNAHSIRLQGPINVDEGSSKIVGEVGEVETSFEVILVDKVRRKTT